MPKNYEVIAERNGRFFRQQRNLSDTRRKEYHHVSYLGRRSLARKSDIHLFGLMQVQAVSIGRYGPYISTRVVEQGNLVSGYKPIRFRGRNVFVKYSTLEERPGEFTIQGPGRLAPPQGQPGIQTEEFMVRDDYPGGGRKKNGKGRNSRVKVDFSILVTGTKRQRDSAFAELEATFLESMPFLERQDGLIGRHTVKRSNQRVKVTQSEINGRKKPNMARDIYFRMKAFVDG